MPEKLRTKFSRLSLSPIERDIARWPRVDTGSLASEDRELYQRRYDALCEYLADKPVAEIAMRHGFDRFEQSRLLQRCLQPHPIDGRMWGCRALVPGIRVIAYRRLRTASVRATRQGGKAGMLTRLFDLNPQIKEMVCSQYLLKRSKVNESRSAVDTTHAYFIKLCREAGIPGHEYPFNTKNLGLRSLGHFLRKIAQTNLDDFISGNYGEEAARLLQTGNGQKSPRVILLPYQRVLFDGHRIDGFFVVTLHNPDGEDYVLVLERPWLLLIQDVATRAILGFHLCLNPEYKKEDVLKCVRSAVEPWKRRTPTVPRLEYGRNAGMPSEMIPGLEWAVWSELSYDNAKANLAETVREQITSTIGAAVNAGPAGCPERRGIIEALFRVLEEKSFHRLPNTTGSHPRDPKRKEPEKAAAKYELSLDHLLDVLHIVICNYNAEAHSTLTWATPLERLRYHVCEEQVVIRQLEPSRRQNLGLLNMRITCTVRGNPKKGRRPYIQFADERYTSEVLSRQPALIGTELTVIVDTEELRSLQAFLPDGTELGFLTALGKWSHTKHSLATRKAANSRRIRKLHDKVDTVDPVHVLLDHLREKAPTDKRALGKFVTVAQEAGLPANFKPAPPPVPIPMPPASPPPETTKEQLTKPRRVMLY